MNILIINQHTLNFGDDIAGISLIRNLLEYKNIRKINIIYNTKGKLPIDNPKIEHNQHIMLKDIGYINLCLYFLFRKLGKKKFNKPLNDLLKIINDSDYIFVSPCGANIGIYKDWRFLIKLLIVIKEGKRPIFHLNTIGKSKSLVFNYFAKKVLKKSTIYVRENKSLQYIKSLGLEAEFGVDTAFSYKSERNNDRDEKYIGFIPTILKGWHPNFKNVDIDKMVFEEIIPTIAKFSNIHELKIKLIPHLKSIEEQEYYKKIEMKLNSLGAKVENMEQITNVYEYDNAIANATFIIGMRYHSIVLAIKNNVPFISLAYENKMQEVCQYSEKSKYSIALYDNNFCINKLEECLEMMFNNRDNIIKELNEVVDKKLVSLSKLPLKEIKEKESNE